MDAYANFEFRNPKRNGSCESGRASWYPYYAGYSPKFVEDSIDFARTLTPVSSILDPWNGSGTTTQIAHSRRIRAEGFDLNPAMVLVAKAKTLPVQVHASIPSLLDDISAKARTLRGALPEDPLTIWLNRRTAGAVRSIDKAIFMLLVQRREYIPLGRLDSLVQVSALASFFYLALFRALRSLLKPFIGSNPTWIRHPKTVDLLLDISSRDITESFRDHASSMHATLVREANNGAAINSVASKVDVAASESLPVGNAEFDLVVSSPPYCTRIDYVVKTSPELAILGIDRRSFRALRDGMIGTPTVSNTPSGSSTAWGPACEGILHRISRHPARASKSYYWKTYVQYFNGLFRSMQEIKRVLRPRGLCFLVVQDSFYKELHVDLATITNEMAEGVGLSQIYRSDFKTSRTMVGLNTISRTYNDTPAHTESVLVWMRSARGVMEKSNGGT